MGIKSSPEGFTYTYIDVQFQATEWNFFPDPWATLVLPGVVHRGSRDIFCNFVEFTDVNKQVQTVGPNGNWRGDVPETRYFIKQRSRK